MKLMPLRVMVWGALAPKLMAWWALVPLLNVVSSSKPVGFIATFHTTAEASAATVGVSNVEPVRLEPGAVTALVLRKVQLRAAEAAINVNVSMSVNVHEDRLTSCSLQNEVNKFR